MNDAIVTIVGVVIAAGLLLALQHWLANVNRYRDEMTEEEYQESLEQGPGVLGAGLMALDQNVFRQSARQAIEFRMDAEHGRLPGGGGGQGESFPPLDDNQDFDGSPNRKPDFAPQSCEPDVSFSPDCDQEYSAPQDFGQDLSSLCAPDLPPTPNDQ